MTRYASIFCIILLVFNYQEPCTANPFLTIEVALDYAVKIIDKITKIQKFVEGEFLDHPEWQGDNKDVVELEIYKQLDRLSTDFQDLRNRILDKITNSLRDKLTEKTDELFKYMKDIQRMYKIFLDFFENADKYESTELIKFAEVTTDFSLVEMKATIEKMHETLVDLDVRRQSIISILAKDSSAADTMCIRGESSQQLIHQLYESVVLTDAKGLIVTLYSYGLKETYENRTYEFRKKKEISDFHERLTHTFNIVKDAMIGASREVWNCDPPAHIKDVTYAKLQQVFQGFFIHETDTTHNNWHAAFHSCEALTDDRLRCKSAPCQAQPPERRCTGRLRECRSIAHYMQICHSPPDSDRRYEWMKTGAGSVFGRDSNCNNTQGLNEFPPYFISTCLCNCESEDQKAVRYFSVKDVTSDVQNNKVVTGIRLVKRGYVFYIQIQQGELGVNGTINNTPEWQNVTETPTADVLSDRVSYYHFKVISTASENDDHEEKYENWTDFYENNIVFAVTKRRSVVYLDDLVANKGELLTGLRFRHANKLDLKIEIQTTPFDYDTGKLKPEESKWISGIDDIKNRQELILSDPDDPSRLLGSDVFSKNNQFIRFRMSDLKRDLGQSTVPYLDLQEVVTHPPLPLAGAGIFHKGKLHSGGFLSFKVIHYDFTPHL